MDKYFYEVFEKIPRQGPGTNQATAKAYKIIQNYLPTSPNILDIGCGKGVQTLELIRLSGSNVIATDKHQVFLDCLIENAKSESLDSFLSCVNADMRKLPFPEKSFDLSGQRDQFSYLA